MSFWEEYIGPKDGPAPFVIIVGDIGSGKSGTMASIIEEYKATFDDRVFLLMDKPAFKNYPRWMKRIDPEKIKIPSNAIFGADDLHLHQHARDWASGKSRPLEELSRERRQTRTMMIVTTQVTRVIDVNLLNMMSTLIIKRPSIAQAKFDRGEIAPMIRKAYAEIKQDEFDKAYVFSNVGEGFEGIIDGIPLPGWFTDDVSNAHREHFGSGVQESPSDKVKQPLNMGYTFLKALGRAVK